MKLDRPTLLAYSTILTHLNLSRGSFSVGNFTLLNLLLLFLRKEGLIREEDFKGRLFKRVFLRDVLKKTVDEIKEDRLSVLKETFYEIEHELAALDGNQLLGLAKSIWAIDQEIIQNNFVAFMELIYSNYLTQSGKHIGSDYFPKELDDLITSFFSKEKNLTLFNPFSNFSSIASMIDKNISFYTGIETYKYSWLLGRLSLLAKGIDFNKVNYLYENSFDYLIEEKLEQYDVVVCGMPFNLRFEPRDPFNPKINKEFATRNATSFVINECLERVKSDGKMLMLVTQGFLSSQNKYDLKLKSKLLKEDVLDKVISLPSKLFKTTSIASSLLVLDKRKEKKHMVELINAESFFQKKSAKVRVLDTDKLVNLINDKDRLFSEKKYLNNSEILDLNLNPKRYFFSDEDLSSINNSKAVFFRDIVVEENPRSSKSVGIRGKINEHFKVIQISDLSKEGKVLASDFGSIDLKKSIPMRELISDGLLISSINNDPRPTYFIKSDERIYLSSNIYAVNVDLAKVNIEYLIYELRKPYVLNQIKAMSTGNTLVKISRSQLALVKIIIPSLKEQEEAVLKEKQAIILKEQEKLKFLTKEYGIDVADQNSFLRHQIAGSVKSVRKSFEGIKAILESQILKEVDSLYQLKTNSKSKLTFGRYLEIMERDLNSIHNSIKITGKELDFADFNPVKVDIVKFTFDYYSELKERKGKVFEVLYEFNKNDLKTANVEKVFISGDKDLLRKVFDNIIENAEKHAFDNKASAKNQIIIQLMFDFDDMSIQIDFMNTGNPLPNDYSHEAFTRKGSKSGLNSGDGFGGWYMNEVMKKHHGSFGFTDETGPEGIGVEEFVTSIELTFPIKVE